MISSAEHSLHIRRDAARTVLLGPLRLLVFMGGGIFLLRVVLARYGLEVIGLWAMLTMAASFVSLADIGFSQQLARDIHVADESETTVQHLLDKRAVGLFYLLVLVAAIALVIPAAMVFMPSISYGPLRFMLAAMLTLWGAVEQLRNKLEASVLAAHQQNTGVQIVNMLGVAVFLAAAISGAMLNAPLEGAALGSLASARWIGHHLRRRVGALRLPARPSLGLAESARRVFRLARAGAAFYSLYLASAIREPSFRMLIALLLGAKSLGIYAIAFRLSVAARDVVAGGFLVLYPSMASLHRAGNREEIVRLQAASLIFLLVLGSLALGGLYSMAEPLFRLVLGVVPENLVAATRILIAWNLITLFNVPFDCLLQATGHERISAACTWAHVLALFLLFACRNWLALSLGDLLLYWTLTSLLSQFILYYCVHVNLGGLRPVLATRPVPFVLALVCAFWSVVFGCVAWGGAAPGGGEWTSRNAGVLLLAALALFGLAYAASRRLFDPFWRAR